MTREEDGLGSETQNNSDSFREWPSCERGNQRERDRESAQARAGHKSKQPRDDGLTPEQRRERDAKALQEKAKRKAAQKAEGNNNGGGKTNKK